MDKAKFQSHAFAAIDRFSIRPRLKGKEVRGMTEAEVTKYQNHANHTYDDLVQLDNKPHGDYGGGDRDRRRGAIDIQQGAQDVKGSLDPMRHAYEKTVEVDSSDVVEVRVRDEFTQSQVRTNRVHHAEWCEQDLGHIAGIIIHQDNAKPATVTSFLIDKNDPGKSLLYEGMLLKS